MVPPAALVDAHCAPMALEFTPTGFGNGYDNGLFMVMRGSWNRTPPSGAKVVFMRFDSDLDTIANSVEDFCSGFIRDTNNQSTRWARPVGLALSADGCVYVSIDEGKQCILKFTPPKAPSSTDEMSNTENGSGVRWSSDRLVITAADTGSMVDVYDIAGNRVYAGIWQGDEHVLDTSTWPQGMYLVRTVRGGLSKSAMVGVTR
jgi:hypothetical protein